MSQKIRCANRKCRRLLLPDPRVKNHRYCDKEGCQRIRRNRWQRQRNRLLQRERDQRRRPENLAKMDALNQESLVKAGSYYLIPGTADLAKMDTLSHKYLLIPIG